VTVTWFDQDLTLTLEVGLSGSTGTYGIWDVALFDTATWGPDVVWTDISAYVRHRGGVETRRRFARDVAAWDAGTMSVVLDNRDGRFSPANMSGPYVVGDAEGLLDDNGDPILDDNGDPILDESSGGITEIRPWRPVRLRATHNAVTYDVFRGYVLAWVEGYVDGPGGGDAICTIRCVDELARLSLFDGLEQTEQGAGEVSGLRVHRILDNAGHSGERNVDIGRVTMQATTLAQNAVADLKLVADSEGGALFIDADGTVVFEHQYALLENTRSNTVQATFGDDAGELDYHDIQVAYDGDLLTNIASFARVGGTAQTSADNTSRALYGDSRFARSDLVCESDAQVLGLAEFYVQRYKDPEFRVTQISVKPRKDPDGLWPQVLGRQVRDLVRVSRRPAGGHTITRDCFIAGISHRFTGDDWSTTFDLWSATPYTEFTTSLWDTATFDSAVFFY
jgi:hypothetical protein